MAEPTATERAIAEGARVSDGAAENLLAEFRAIQAELGGPEDEETEAAQLGQQVEEEPAKPAPAKGKDGRFVKADKPAEKTGTEGKLTVKDRVELREERRRMKGEFSAREQRLAQREQQLAAKEQTLGHISRARELYDAGDYDGAAQAAFGAKSWNDLNDGAARAFASPEYKRVKQLEQKTAELSAERERERQAAMTAQQQAREQQVLGQFRANLAEQLPKAEDETIAALAETDPSFVDAVFQRVVQAARGGEDLDPLEVAEEIVEQARAHYERVSKVFGGRPTSQAEAARAASPDRAGRQQQPVKPQKHVSRSTATETSAPPEFATDAEWLAYGTKALKRAHLEDEVAGRSTATW